MHKHDGSMKMRFQETERGLYLHRFPAGNPSKKRLVFDYVLPNTNQYALLSTVQENLTRFTEPQVKKANEAKILFEIVGRPSLNEFIRMIRENTLQNCPVKEEDIKRAFFIYGRSQKGFGTL